MDSSKFLASDLCSLKRLMFVLNFRIADTKFQNQATRVLNKEAAEVDDVTVIRDNDHLYVISETQAQLEPQGECLLLADPHTQDLPSICYCYLTLLVASSNTEHLIWQVGDTYSQKHCLL